MRFRQLAAATVMVAVLSSCGTTQLTRGPQLPLAEPPACAKIEPPKCEQKCAPRAIFQRLKGLIEKSDIVLVGEAHSWVGHYGELAANMDELVKLGVKKIFIELPISYNEYITRYQQLRKESLNPDISEKDNQRIIREMARIVAILATELSYFHDPAKFGYLLALLDRATVNGVSVVAVDTIDDGSIPKRNEYMSSLIIASLKKDEKALWLGGDSHPEGMSRILGTHLGVSVFYVTYEILNPQ